MSSTVSANVGDKTAEKLKMLAALVRVRLEKATDDLASEHRFGGPQHEDSEIDILQEATALCLSVEM